jgi:DNA polymerase-3 subunit beta
LFDIVRKLSEGSQVELAVAGDKMTVVANRSRFSLATLKRDDFPVIAETELPTVFSLPAKDLRELIDSTRFAISTEETRYYLNGIYIHAVEGVVPKLRAVATDGHRLARIELDLPEGAATMPGVIVPRKCVAEVRKLLDEYGDDAPIEVSLSTSKIRFRFSPEATLTSKLIDGTFPDYSRVIPTANDRILKIDTRSLSEGVDRVAAIATTEKTRAVKLALSRDKVTLSVTSPENGTAAEDVPAEYSSPEFEVGFNYRYLLDILGQVGSDQVDVHLADAAAPTLIRESDDSRALYVLMPMRV